MRARSRLFATAIFVLGAWAHDARADDAMTQCIAASEQGLDQRKAEKLIDARKTLAACATTRCPDEIRTVCEQRINDINGAIPTVLFDVTDGAGVPQALGRLTVDGVAVPTPLAGKATAFDPGLHTFRFDVAGQPPVEKKLLLKEFDHDRHESVVVGAASAPPPAAAVAPAPAPSALVDTPSAAPAPAAPASTPAPPEATHDRGAGQRIAGAILLPIGAGGLVVGGVFGIFAISKWSTAQKECGSGCPSGSQAQKDKDDASTAATISTVGVIGGLAVTAAAGILLATAPRPTATGLRVVPSVAPGEAAVFLRGNF